MVMLVAFLLHCRLFPLTSRPSCEGAMVWGKSRRLQRVLDLWPGKRLFGMYRFLPLFFCLGAALEFSMINWHVGQTNFYRTFKRRQATKLAIEQLREEERV
ncbi:hypothetical protein O3P69_019761 [Scylla paramamosain]|uniref:Small integral membrane protein 4 n=1 Tax=Scylla paramamosain TaxID=85552 RepID=A0AAW0SY81_SCYPA